MSKSFFARAWLATGLVLWSLGSAHAESLDELVQQVWQQHPEVQAAQARVEAERARLDAAGQPLYNPELELDLEQASARTSTLGISQTLDWADKRGARAELASSAMQEAEDALALARQQILGELLSLLNQYHTARQTAELTRQQSRLLEDFLDLAQQRFAAGDISQPDVDLARLSLAEMRMRAAARATERALAESRRRALVSEPVEQWPPLPDLPQAIARQDQEQLLRKHPALRQLAARLQAARHAVTLAKRQRRADPTLALRGGKEDSDTLLGLTFSMPLNLRNTFRAEVQAAEAEVNQARQAYRNAYLRARAELAAAEAQFRLNRAALDAWQQGGQASLQGRVESLERLWRSGEISTTDYLVQLGQALDTRIAAAELVGANWQAWLAWLDAAGQTETWLGLNEGPAR